jgi:glycosyltransferase involved in cell wall biosynthesis
MKPLGGSELLYNNLIKLTGTDWQQQVNLIMSFCTYTHLDPSRLNVVWQHLYTDQGALVGMDHPDWLAAVDHFVYVSDWQLDQFKNKYNIDHLDNRVIKNAINPIEFKPKSKDRIQLIYTSMPQRGLEVLLDAFEMLNRNDVDLTIYSSNIIYGKNYDPKDNAQQLFHRARSMKNVFYKGYALNQAVRKSLQNSHILAYPSTFPETSCLSAIEAGAAGCKIVTTDFGALPETCGDWATFVPYTEDREELAKNYAEALNLAIDNYESECYNIQEQSDWFNETYSWDRRAEEWKRFFEEICVK